MTVGWLHLLGCSSIMNDYEHARAQALAEPGPPPVHWVPDARVDLSLPLLDGLVHALVDAHGGVTGARSFTGPLGVRGTFTPRLDVESLRVVRSQGCAECVTLMVDLGGSLSFDLLGASGSLPVSAAATADVTFETAREEDGWTVSARVADLQQLDLELGGAGDAIGPLVAPVLSTWLSSGFLSDLPQVPIVSIAASELPLRALRVAAAGGGIQIEMLSSAPTPGVLPSGGAAPADGWTMSIAQDSLLALAKRAAFEQGPVSYDVVVEPTALAVDGAAFDLGLRLWRVSGAGWWRDYTVNGTLDVSDDAVHLTAQGVVEGEKSPGAIFVDPLAALAEGAILGAIEDAVATTLPGSSAADLAGLPARLQVTDVRGAGGALTLTGTLSVQEGDADGAPRSRPRERRRRP